MRSSADKGSSNNKTSGFPIKPRAKDTLCCSPPLKLSGIRSKIPSIFNNLTTVFKIFPVLRIMFVFFETQTIGNIVLHIHMGKKIVILITNGDIPSFDPFKSYPDSIGQRRFTENMWNTCLN